MNMRRIPESKRAPEPSRTRTNRDWIMIVLGVFLAVLFVVAGYTSYTGSDTKPSRKIRGPVKDPKRSSDLGESNPAVTGYGDRFGARFHAIRRIPGFRRDYVRLYVRSIPAEEQWKLPDESESGRARGVVDSRSGLQACSAPAAPETPTAHEIPAKREKPSRRAYGEIHAVT